MPSDTHSFARLATTVFLLATLAGFLTASYVPFIRVTENWLHDVRVALFTAPTPQSENIIIIAVSEETLAAFPYRSPIDRGFLASVLRTLVAKGVILVGLDILFDQPTEFDKDAALRRILREADVPIVVAAASEDDPLTPAQLSFLRDYIADTHHGIPAVTVDALDATVRAVPLRLRGDGWSADSFVSVLARQAGRTVPANDSIFLDYRAESDSGTPPFAIFAAEDVGVIPADWLAGRIALVGAVLPFQDRYRTPLDLKSTGGQKSTPGVVIQAHALAQILEGRNHRLLAPWQVMLVIALSAAAGIGTAKAQLSLVTKGVATTAALVIFYGSSILTYRAGGPILPLVVPTLTFLATSAFVVAIERQRERARGQFLLNAFSKFVAPSVVQQLIEEPERLTLTGERRDTTFLFTDIAGFTTLTEQLDPETLIIWINEYLDGICRIVLRHEGTIDKIVGDALVVMFNAPVPQPDHPERAVMCGLELDRFCQDFAARHHTEKVQFGQTRIGINTGVTTVGNFGGDTRFNYTAQGDVINAAARLESANKQFGTRMCVSGSTRARCPNLAFRPIGQFRLKGQTQLTEVFEPVDPTNSRLAPAEEYERAFSLMCEKAPGSHEVFETLAQTYPDDYLVMYHRGRLIKGDTGGIIAMTEK